MRTRRTTVRWWRFRRNPLRRRSDVIEAWVVLIAWLIAVVGGVIAGVVTAGAVVSLIAQERAERQKVTAVVTGERAEAQSYRTRGTSQVRATVRWTAPDGSARTGHTQVPSSDRTGTRVTGPPRWSSRSASIASRTPCATPRRLSRRALSPAEAWPC
ncbi:Rv1733c family protein [Streptomyces antnestii]|uniref:Rv1733c family protein n=1 Tax=Streptomyces antnestii TaxID=2494256 RepID=UPI003D6689A7